MKDLDFDELDKAVNSLTSEQQKKPEQTNVNAQSGPTIHPEALLLSSNPDTAIEDPELAKVPETNLRSHPVMPPISNRRNGHLDFKRPSFGTSRGVIDIMAPKSASTSASAAPMRPASRVAATVHPIANSNISASHPTPMNDAISQSPEGDMPDEATLKSVENEITRAARVKETTSGEEKWPDPLDLHLDIKEEEQSSPFLPDAKVAKRPLGAYAEYTPTDITQPAGNVAPTVSETEKRNDDMVDKPVETKTEMQPTKQEAPMPDVPVHEKEIREPAPTPRPVEQQVRDSAMLSIPQQYRTADKPADIAPRPVFDTKEYHPPLLEDLSETSRRGKMWLKLIIVLIVLAVIGVGGYFAFINFVQH